MALSRSAATEPDVSNAVAIDPADAGFSVSLSNFSGPFDLLLSLITKHELDITEVSLSRVTDEFISYLRGLDSAEELDQASEFLVVAATLLDLKVAGLLPQGELVDAEDVALLEARDLLFARLLQYRAFKEAAQWFASGLERESTRHFRSVRLEEKYRRQTPELVWTLTVGATPGPEPKTTGAVVENVGSEETTPGLVPGGGGEREGVIKRPRSPR